MVGNGKISRMSKNSEYFKIYCELATELFNRSDKNSPAVKSVIRYVVREATNTSSDLPGYDNKLGAKYMSLSAGKQMAKGQFVNLIGEHIVPVSVIIKVLEDGDIFDEGHIARTIEKLSVKAVITKDEDMLLKEAGLSNRMPVNWDIANGIKARYKTVGIELTKSKYKELKTSSRMTSSPG